MRFAMSYSGGKDSVLALYRMIQAGHEPVALVSTLNPEQDRSWFHGIPRSLLEAVSDSLRIPLVVCACRPEEYGDAFSSCLKQTRELGAEACAFGDIDIVGHRQWDEERCREAGLACELPLWQEDRAALTTEGIEAGFRAMIKLVHLEALDASFLGKTLTRELMTAIAATGADICGENGEYHTFVYDGPLFAYPIPLRMKGIVSLGTHAVADMEAESFVHSNPRAMT